MRKPKGLWLDSSPEARIGGRGAVLNRIVSGKEFNLFAQLRVTVFYSGRVQGVGFRYTVKRLVCGFDVLGTVQNLADGRVKLVAEGDSDELKEFLLAVDDSGLGPMIRDEQVSWSEGTGEFRGFEIVR